MQDTIRLGSVNGQRHHTLPYIGQCKDSLSLNHTHITPLTSPFPTFGESRKSISLSGEASTLFIFAESVQHNQTWLGKQPAESYTGQAYFFFKGRYFVQFIVLD